MARDPRGDHGCAHASATWIQERRIANPLARQIDRRSEDVGDWWSGHRRAVGLADGLDDRVDRDPRRDVAGVVSAEAVGDDT